MDADQGHHPALGPCTRCGSSKVRPIGQTTAIACTLCGHVISAAALADLRAVGRATVEAARDELLGEIARAHVGVSARHLHAVTS